MDTRAIQRMSADQLTALGKIARVEKEEWYQGFLRAAVLTGDPQLERTFLTALRPLAVEQIIRDVPFSRPAPGPLKGYLSAQRPILHGRLADSAELFVDSIEDRAQHTLVLGGTGTGKTNYLYGAGLQARRYCSVFYVDNAKQDDRHLLRMWPGLIILDAQRDLRFNPLEVPDGVRPQHHLASFVTTFVKCNSLLDGSEALLLKVTTRLYQEHGIFDGSENYPTLADLLNRIVHLKIQRGSREAGYQDSLRNRLESYLATNGDCYAPVRGFSIAELAEKSVVLEVKGLTERHVRCLLSWMLLALFNGRIARNERGQGLRTLIIVDECKYLIPYGYNEQLGFSTISTILAQCREVGMGFVFADQTAQLEDAAFVQTRTKLCFRLGSGEDIEKVRKSLGLTEEQAAYIPKLDTGQAIVRVPQLDPFLIRVPRVRLQ